MKANTILMPLLLLLFATGLYAPTKAADKELFSIEQDQKENNDEEMKMQMKMEMLPKTIQIRLNEHKSQTRPKPAQPQSQTKEIAPNDDQTQGYNNLDNQHVNQSKLSRSLGNIDNSSYDQYDGITFADSSGKQVEDNKTKEQGQDNNNPDEEEEFIDNSTSQILDEHSNETKPEPQSQNNSDFASMLPVIVVTVIGAGAWMFSTMQNNLLGVADVSSVKDREKIAEDTAEKYSTKETTTPNAESTNTTGWGFQEWCLLIIFVILVLGSGYWYFQVRKKN